MDLLTRREQFQSDFPIEYQIIVAMAELLVPDICACIMELIDQYHFHISLVRWKRQIVDINKFYRDRYIPVTFSTPNMRCIVNFQEYTDPTQFNHNFSSRSYNHRDLNDIPVITDRIDHIIKNYKHYPSLVIANAHKCVSTHVCLPENYYSQRLYK